MRTTVQRYYITSVHTCISVFCAEWSNDRRRGKQKLQNILIAGRYRYQARRNVVIASSLSLVRIQECVVRALKAQTPKA